MNRKLIFASVPLILLLLVATIYLSGGRYISTENAYVRSGIAMVSARTSGQVETVFVRENQHVDAGAPLFVLDLEPFDIAVERAKATLDDAREGIAILQSKYERQKVQLTAADENRVYTLRELKRVKGLTNAYNVSKERVSQRQHAFDAAVNNVATARADVMNALVALGGDEKLAVDDHPSVRSAQGALSQAELNRRHATTTAGMPGIVAKIDLHPGEFVQAGQPAFSIVRTDDIWIEANLKETQLTNLRIGQSASFEVDAYPDTPFTGTVTSVAPASGAEFAILPPQNATGNWIKITQRIPIRLQINPDQDLPTLRAGMSVEVTIDTERTRSISDIF
ncbi:MAG: HlyD family secretion protein [Parvibaculaceae bacterium]|nr:HlyD family secretion protein [Parvibaculaceae bacterium]